MEEGGRRTDAAARRIEGEEQDQGAVEWGQAWWLRRGRVRRGEEARRRTWEERRGARWGWVKG